MSLIVSGDQPLLWLRQAAENIRDDLLTKMGLTKVQLTSPRSQEISIEISEGNLKTYGYTLGEISERIRSNAIDLHGGTVYDSYADIALRTKERREWAHEFSDIVVAETGTGFALTLGDIATLKDGFGTSPIEAWYNGKPAIQIDVYTVGNETPQSVEKIVKDYLESTAMSTYKGVSIDIFENQAQAYRERLDLLINNALLGLVLVIILLMLFLTPEVAFWVTMGIPTSLLGALLLMPVFGASINMFSLFAFIITIGVVVDDAIMVGEAIYTYRSRGMDGLSAAVQGIKMIGIPVLVAVLTTMIIFIPLFFVSSGMGTIFTQIPAVVVSALFVSLVESIFILSSHLSKKHPEKKWLTILGKPQRHINGWMERFTDKGFKRFINWSLDRPMIMIASTFSLLMITISAVGGGWLGFSYTPTIQSDTVIAHATLPYGTPKTQSIVIREKLVKDAQSVLNKNGLVSPGIYSVIGAKLEDGEIDSETLTGSHYVSVLMALPPIKDRHLSGQEFARQWQDAFGETDGLEALTFTGETSLTGGDPVNLELYHPEASKAREAAQKLGELMGRETGLTSVDDGLRAGKPELKVTLNDHGMKNGIAAQELAEQIRHRFYGAEALRISRGGNDIKVMVRLSEKERGQISSLENLLLKTPSGTFIPLIEIASITQGKSTTRLSRRDGKRIYSVTAQVMPGISDDEMAVILRENVLPLILDQYPGLQINFTGDQEEMEEGAGSLGKGFFIAIGLIFALLALQFNSYIQPLLIFSVFPFAIIGAVWGHIILGYELSIVSVIGMIAMAGVVVNDSIVLMAAFNHYRNTGNSLRNAIVLAACRRLRPIVLTTLTTFFGLVPLMLETSMQAQFLIPMAVSISFGLIFGTFIILVVLPALIYLFSTKTACAS